MHICSRAFYLCLNTVQVRFPDAPVGKSGSPDKKSNCREISLANKVFNGHWNDASLFARLDDNSRSNDRSGNDADFPCILVHQGSRKLVLHNSAAAVVKELSVLDAQLVCLCLKGNLLQGQRVAKTTHDEKEPHAGP